MNIQWVSDHPESDYSSRTGKDEEGNIYRTPANLETVSVKTPDGFRGEDWTAEKALKNAIAARQLAKAAPDLLDACKSAVNELHELFQIATMGEGCAPSIPVIDKLHAAIAKTEVQS
jgi:hypothetical protein